MQKSTLLLRGNLCQIERKSFKNSYNLILKTNGVGQHSYFRYSKHFYLYFAPISFNCFKIDKHYFYT